MDDCHCDYITKLEGNCDCASSKHFYMISLHIHWVIRVIEEDFRAKISICLSLSEVHIVKVDSNETILHCKMSKVL